MESKSVKEISGKIIVKRVNILGTTMGVSSQHVVNLPRPTFDCLLCSFKGKFKPSLDRHMTVHTQENFKCRICGKEFRWSVTLTNHERTHSAYPPFKCKPCNKVFTTSRALQYHNQSQHNADGPTYSCELCRKQFMKSQALKRHMDVHLNNQETRLCEYCGVMLSKCAYRAHVKKHTGEAQYNCHLCDKKFVYEPTFKRHVDIVHRGIAEEKRFQCTHCGLLFRKISFLKSHMIKHSDERPFACDTCDKTYRSLANLKSHKNMHLGIMPYSCDVCGRTFRNYCNKLKHQRRHSNERPFKCNICEKAFFEKQELFRHKQRHETQG